MERHSFVETEGDRRSSMARWCAVFRGWVLGCFCERVFFALGSLARHLSYKHFPQEVDMKAGWFILIVIIAYLIVGDIEHP